MTDAHANLRDYYETEARLRRRGPLRGGRLSLRDDFIALLRDEKRTSLADFGAGPGRDGEGFVEAGLAFVGIDLAHRNACLAAEAGVTVVQASLAAVPIRSSVFDAAWSLSTLMHFDEADAACALQEILRTLRAGAPLLVGVWGHDPETYIEDAEEIPGSRRPFHLRSFKQNQTIMETHGDLERCEKWEGASDTWDYHVFQIRKR